MNAGIIQNILAGKTGPASDIVALNAGAAIYISGLAADLKDGIALAKKSISSGAAQKTLTDWISLSRSFISL